MYIIKLIFFSEENAESMSRHVNSLAVTPHTQNGSVVDCMYNPRPQKHTKLRPSTAHPTSNGNGSIHANGCQVDGNSLRVTVDLNKQTQFKPLASEDKIKFRQEK